MLAAMLVLLGLLVPVAAGSGCSKVASSHDDAAPSAMRAQEKPVPPVRLALVIRQEVPRRGEDIHLDLTLTTTVGLPRVRAVLRLPSPVRLIGEERVWEGPLTPETPRTLTFRVRIEGQERFNLGASVEILEGPYASQIAGGVLYVDATRPEIRWSPRPLEP